MNTPASLVTIAKRLDFIRETQGPNRGYWVEFLQRFCDGVPGDSWCADFESVVENVAYEGHAPTPRTGSTTMKLDFCKKKGWIVTHPQVDDIYFYVYPDGVTAHHIGIVSGVTPLTGIAGNTSQDGTSSNGDGVYDHTISAGPTTVFARLPKTY
jgi:hypothetical protein